MLAILLLAAGSSSRMRGGDKLLEPVQDTPLLRKMALMACDVSPHVIVCVAPQQTLRRAALNGLPVTVVEVPDAADGMAHSLRAGVSTLPKNASAAMVVPSDMPELTTSDLRAMVAQHLLKPTAILRGASADGTPGHPVLFPRHFFYDLCQLCGDTGARSVLKTHSTHVKQVVLPAQHALTDLDTPEEWRSWRNRTGQ